ncbi:MAG: glycoside hydrolase family 127 protein [Clostridia bacterium]|nr:glycoside hydrolase family 127 protein [Clostridia bacterium]
MRIRTGTSRKTIFIRAKKLLFFALVVAAATAVSGAFAFFTQADVKAESFNIAEMEGLQIRLDASTLDLDNGQAVSEWQNLAEPTLSGVVTAATQTDSSRKPVYSLNAKGLPAVRFYNTSYMRFSGTRGFYLKDMTVFAVLQANKTDGYNELFSRLSASPYDHNWFFNVESGFNFGWGARSVGGGVTYHQARVPFDTDVPVILNGVRTGGTGYSYINGWCESTFKGPLYADTGMIVNLGGTGNDSFDGYLSELIVFDRALTDDERINVENYLEEKWQIANDKDALLRSIKINGKEITGFYPTNFDYNYLTTVGVTANDVSATAFSSEDDIDISVAGDDVKITVRSAKTGKTEVYTVKIESLKYSYGEIRDLQLNEVTVNSGFWSKLIGQYSDYTINYIFDMFEYSHSFDNFDRVARGERQWLGNLSAHAGEILIPSGANRLIGKKTGAWDWGVEPWREGLIMGTIQAAGNFIIENSKRVETLPAAVRLKERLSSYVDRIYAAALTTTGTDYKGKVIDGFFSTYNLLKSNSVFDEASGGSIWNHDLYNFGCYVEAGVSWYKATGDTRLLYVATRFAEFVVDYMYGGNGYDVVPPHQIAEETLLDMYDLYKNNPQLVKEMEDTYSCVEGLSPNDKYYVLDIRYGKYLDICNDWIAKRGVSENRYGKTNYGVYAQDQCTHDEMGEALGHAVRANLWYSGIAAIGNYTGNFSFVNSAKTLWDNIVGTQLYVTGGTGASASLGEAYAGSYVLPQDGYCETCASAGMAYFADNMFSIFGSSEYADVMELELYNGILGSLSLHGDAFYYTNPLVSDNYVRPNWSGATPCCPPMFMKVFAYLPTYIYAKSSDTIFVNQYVASTAETNVNGVIARLIQGTDIPDGNKATFIIDSDGAFKLKLRMPSWASGYELLLNGAKVNAAVGGDGYIELDKKWKAGDKVEIIFDKEVKLLRQEKVKYNNGQVAVQYGPFIYCAESTDNVAGGGDLVKDVFFTINGDTQFTPVYDWTKFAFYPDGVSAERFPLTVLKGSVLADIDGATVNAKLTLVPFFARGNRNNGGMRVWFYESAKTVAFDGEPIDFEFNDSSKYTLYGGDGGARFTDYGILFSADKEYKLMLNDVSADDCEVTFGITFGSDSVLNSGVYLCASDPADAQDSISAVNVQIERSASASEYVVSVFGFDSHGGFLGKLAGSGSVGLSAGNIKIRCVVKEGELYVFIGNSKYPLIVYELGSDYRNGSIGIRSMCAGTRVTEFTVSVENDD